MLRYFLRCNVCWSVISGCTYSEALKMTSFSCCALMKASLKRLASVVMLASFMYTVGSQHHLLSLLANRMAKVCASGSPSLTSAAAFHTQDRSDPTLGLNFMSGTT